MKNADRTEEEKILKRREGEDSLFEIVNEVLTLRRKPLKRQKKLKLKVRTSLDEFTFLQYLPLLYLWAVETKGITRKDLDTLFYLQPLIVFTAAQIVTAQKELGRHDPKMVGRLKTKGWISVYSKYKTNINYILSNKASGLITKMYKMMLLERPLPMHYNKNFLVARNPSKQDGNIMEALKEFNRRVREKAENKT